MCRFNESCLEIAISTLEVYVVHLGGSAEAAGLKPGDCIIEINGINVRLVDFPFSNEEVFFETKIPSRYRNLYSLRLSDGLTINHAYKK